MRIAIVEPYYGGSHKAWADGYRDHSAHEVALFTHEARFWKWRMHGSYVTLAGEFRAHVAAEGRFDVILASDMLHVPAFLGAIGETRGDAAVALYMHENQMTYPLSPRDSVDESYAMINWGSMAVADAVFFNSRYHHEVWFGGIEALLKRFPDYRHTALLPSVRGKAEVLTVGVDLARLDGAGVLAFEAPLVLWNQRWDFDKGPEEFAAAMFEASETHDFRIALAGEVIGEIPAFTELQERLADRLVHVGFAADELYASLLASADIVVSTATQEFFGIAVTEAVYAAAFPLLPNDLVYPERIPRHFHDKCLYERGALADRLRWALDNLEEARSAAASLQPLMAGFDWRHVAPEYDRRLAALAS